MNKAETTFVERELGLAGWTQDDSSRDADLVILNTCSVRSTAEQRIIGRLGYYKTLKKEHTFDLAVMGCMAERMKEELVDIEPSIDFVIGNFQKGTFVRYLTGGSPEKYVSEDSRTFVFPDTYGNETSFRALVPVMHGCDNFCSYCIVPYVRGREVSRNCSHISDEVGSLSIKGVKEITLLGQNVNSYRFSEGGIEITFPQLLKKLTLQDTYVPWIRFLTSHPKDFSSELIDVIAGNNVVCKHIHLPVQHGSNEILNRMNRKYTREHYLQLISNIRKRIPDVSLTTDILIGFPGETEKDIALTMDLMKEVRFQDAFTYYFNPIEGTAAYTMSGRIPHDEQIKRLSKIIELQHNITGEIQRSRIGRKEKVLVESLSKKSVKEVLGRTERNEMVVFTGDSSCIGEFRTVELMSYSGNTFRAEEVA